LNLSLAYYLRPNPHIFNIISVKKHHERTSLIVSRILNSS
jgi:hypothetical protein